MDLDWDDDVLRMEVRRLRRGQIGRKRKQPGQGTAPNAAHSQKLHVAKVAKVSKCGKKRPLHTPLANAWLKVNLASSVQTIRLGTECSGLEAVMVAMEKMGLMDQTQLKLICERCCRTPIDLVPCIPKHCL